MKKIQMVNLIMLVFCFEANVAFPQLSDTEDSSEELKTIDLQGRPLESTTGVESGNQAPSVTPEQMAQMMKTLQEAKLKQEEAQKALKEIEENE